MINMAIVLHTNLEQNLETVVFDVCVMRHGGFGFLTSCYPITLRPAPSIAFAGLTRFPLEERVLGSGPLITVIGGGNGLPNL